MNQLNVINDGALLIRNGVIDESGPARRVENLAHARKAREIDASGKIVMPAFVDPDGVLVVPALPSRTDLRVMSRRILEIGALGIASDGARLGVLAMGAHTRHASSLKDTVKILRVHSALQRKPLRVRSILSPRDATLAELDQKWLPLIRRRKLASIIEFTADDAEKDMDPEQIRAATLCAADHGLAIRIRCIGPASAELHSLAREAGALAWIGFPLETPSALIDFGGVCVLPCSDLLRDEGSRAAEVRRAVDDGMPIALSSGYGMEGARSGNPQFLLYLAVTRMGLTCEEAIMALTYNAACSLKMSHVTGSLEPGKAANLIVMDVPDYRELARRVGHNDVFQVVSDGQTVYRRGVVGKSVVEKFDPRL